jgi:outer membrane protein insertion porin family
MELRHPVIAGQSATIFLLAFAEGGNVWDNFNQFNPFNVRRSVGVWCKDIFTDIWFAWVRLWLRFDKIPGQPDANKGTLPFYNFTKFKRRI